MCLIFLSLNNHPTYKLVVAANRDEFYQRKTAPAGFWHDHPDIVGGRDLEASGTWLGMTRQGRISLVTNYRDLKNLKQQAPSRGALVSEFLSNNHYAKSYLQDVSARAAAYNGFNLITGNVDELWYFSNYQNEVRKIETGLYGLSNALLDTPWPKVENGKKNMKSILDSSEINPTDLFELLYNEERASDNTLPDTGVGLERERMLSSMFIKSLNYGTRCSTVILVDHNQQVMFSERVYDLETFHYSTRTFEFQVSSSS